MSMWWKIILGLVLVLGGDGLLGQDRPKVGLVLSGGGARGFAHVGTLALIDSLNIPVDYIAGTSMGGIIGALYSIGYDAVEIDRLIREMDWGSFFSDAPPRQLAHYFDRKSDGKYQVELELKGWAPVPPSGLISGQKIRLELSQFTYAFENITHFDDLPIPYRCMAVDLITGNEVVLEQGSLSKALRATMSIPTLFDPVTWGDSLLVDGGLLNNVPADVVKDMGADIIIASNVGSDKRTREELQTLVDILEQSIYLPGYLREEENLPLADLVISPELDGLNPAIFSVSNIDSILAAGYRAAFQQQEALITLAETHDLASPRTEFVQRETPSRLYGLQFTGNTSLPFTYLYELSGLAPGDTIDADRVEAGLRRMRRSPRIQDVDYTAVFEGEDKVSLKLHVTESRYPTIAGIQIKGNERLPYSFIYEILNIHAGDSFKPDVIAEQISQLYSLGVFQTIHYEIKPIDAESLTLVIQIAEKPKNLLRLGWRYDNEHNLIGHIGVVHDEVLVPGLRMEGEIWMAGRKKLDIRFLYPLTIADLSVFPYVRIMGRDDARTLYDFGEKIAIYFDQNRRITTGIGLLPSRPLILEVEYGNEYVQFVPEVGGSATLAWETSGRRLQVRAEFDDLDNVLIPQKGRLIEAEYTRSFSNDSGHPGYHRFELNVDHHSPLSETTSLRFHTHLGLSKDMESLTYAWFYNQGAEDFVGNQIYELSWNQFLVLRLDLRHEVLPGWYARLSYNIAPNPSWGERRLYPTSINFIQGFGIGVLYDSYVGPMELTFGLGDKITEYGTKELRPHGYFSVGLKF